MKLKFNIAATLSMLILAAGIQAHAESPQERHHNSYKQKYERHIEERFQEQQHRIRQGIRNGKLTPREAKRLRREQFEIRLQINRAKDDGFISAGEARRIDRMQDRAQRNIFSQKHDGQGR